jgi:hypothetical protein
MKKLTVVVTALIGLVAVNILPVNAALIDLNDFYSYPDDKVTVNYDGSLATLSLGPLFSSVMLSNDPGFGDPNVIIPEPGKFLSFDYQFCEAVGEEDEFGAFVIDAGTGISAGLDYQFFIEESGSGSVSFDLSALTGKTLGLQFQISYISGGSYPEQFSKAIVSNVTLASVPEPTTLLLVGTGLFGLLGMGRRKFSHKR